MKALAVMGLLRESANDPGPIADLYLAWLPKRGKRAKETVATSAAAPQLRTKTQESAAKGELGPLRFTGSFREAAEAPESGAEGTTNAPGRRFRTVLLQEGMGNFEDCFYYTRAAIQSCVPLFEGKKFFIDHADAMEEKTRPERSIKDVGGWFENLAVEDAQDGRALLVGDLVTLVDSPEIDMDGVRALMRESIEYSKNHAGKDLVGLSISAGGDFDTVALEQFIRSEEIPEGCKAKLAEASAKGISMVRPVRRMTSATSCDLVTEAGAGGRISQLLERERGTMAKKIKEAESKENKEAKAKEDGAGGEPAKDGSGDGKAGGAKHDDADKDKELIKSMLQKHCGDGFTDEDNAMATEAYQAALEAHGGDEKEAMETAGRVMKMAKHSQSKKAAEAKKATDAEAAGKTAEAQEAGSKTEEAGKTEESTDKTGLGGSAATVGGPGSLGKTQNIESASPDEVTKLKNDVVRLTGENASLRSKIEERELGDFIDKTLRESNLPMKATKKFRECIAGIKTQKEISEKLKIFQEAWVGGAGEGDAGGFFIQPEKTVTEEAAGKFSAADCLNN